MNEGRHYVEGTIHTVLIQFYRKNIKYFPTLNVLSGRQARWPEILSMYHFVINHFEVKNNTADVPSRRLDYEIGYDSMTATLLATLAATTITESYHDLLPEILGAQETAFLATEI
jgi:hypothetical protein